jgi:hypothetical protein
MRSMLGFLRARLSPLAGCALVFAAGVASAQDDARTKQLQLLCSQLSGDLTDPGGIAAFRRCMTSKDPLGEIRRDNNIATPPDRPNAAPPGGFGGDARRHVADGIERFQAAENNLIYALDTAGRLWRGTVGENGGALLDQKVAAFQVADGHLFVQSCDGTLWRAKLDGGERTRVDGAVAAFQAINAGLIYVLGTDQRLWRESGDAGKRVEVDRAAKDFQAIDASLVYVLALDQQLWRELGTMQSRTHVADRIAAFQYLPDDDTIYVQTAEAVLWRQRGSGKGEQVDRSVAAFQAVDGQVAYVLGTDGRLWREVGGRDHATLVDRDVLVASGKAAFRAVDATRIYLLGSDHRLWAESMPPVSASR